MVISSPHPDAATSGPGGLPIHLEWHIICYSTIAIHRTHRCLPPLLLYAIQLGPCSLATRSSLHDAYLPGMLDDCRKKWCQTMSHSALSADQNK
jgi:hypothetical protein